MTETKTLETRSSAIAVIADRTALRDIYFNAIHCYRSVSTCE